jgi:hypothetical protein
VQRDRDRSGEPELAVVVFRQWRDDPVGALAAAVRAAASASASEPIEEVAPRGGTLTEALVDANASVGDVYVILDQFEEYFLYHSGEEGADTLPVELPRAIRNRSVRASFLLSIREDALAELDRFKGRLPGLFDGSLRIAHLDRAGARAAIEQPLVTYNRLGADPPASIEPELVDAVLDQVTSGRVYVSPVDAVGLSHPSDARIEAPYLQLVMSRLWVQEQEFGSSTLRLQTLELLGGAERIARSNLDDALNALTVEEEDIAADVFHFLVTRSGTKIAHTAADLADFAGRDESDVAPVLDRLAAADVRILRPVAPPSAQDGATRYEIFHDVIGPAILDWRARYVQERTMRETVRRERRKSRIYAAVAVGAMVNVVMVAFLAFWALQQAR